MFTLDMQSNSIPHPDIKCPKCNQAYDICWSTEYGELIHGWHKTECMECNHGFSFHASIIEVYEVKNNDYA